MTKPRRYLENRGKEERAARAKAANRREAEIAKQYFNAGPSIGNLARAAYHWYNSVPILGGQDENGNILYTGEAPSPGMRNPSSIVNSVKKVKAVSSFDNWEKAINKQNTVYDDAMKAVEEGKRIYNKFINSSEYLDRIKKSTRVQSIRDAYKSAKNIRREQDLSFDWKEPWSPYRGMTLEQAKKANTEHNNKTILKILDREKLGSEANDIFAKKELADIKKANELSGVKYQDRIEWLDNEGNLISHPSAAGRYDRASKDIQINVNSSDIPTTYIHEHGGHRTNINNFLRNNLIGYDRNGDSNIKTWIDFDPQWKKYYTSFDEARSRTIPILAKMHDKGYKLSYNGFKKYLKDNNMKVSDTELHPYDEKTVRHLINTVYGIGGGMLLYNGYNR